MAYSPDKASQPNASENQAINAIESAVDKYLETHYQGTGTIEVPISEPTTPLVKRRVEQMYVTAGWKRAEVKDNKNSNATLKLSER